MVMGKCILVLSTTCSVAGVLLVLLRLLSGITICRLIGDMRADKVRTNERTGSNGAQEPRLIHVKQCTA